MTTPPPYTPEPQPAPQSNNTQSYNTQSYEAQPAAQSYPPQPAAPRTALSTTMAHTNTFAVIAVILAFIQPIAGIIFGHMAMGQIKRNGDSGRGLALTGLILGYIYLAFIVIFVVLYVSIIALAIGSASMIFDDMSGMNGYDSF